MNLNNNLKISSATLVVSNLLLVYGILGFGFSLFTLMFVYWFENVVIGFFNVLKMMRAKGIVFPDIQVEAKNINFLKKMPILFLVFFFVLHYGMFTFVHGVFVFAIFSGFGFSPGDVLYGAIILIISHGTSFVVNYIGNKEYENKNPIQLFYEPYKRIVVLHLVIIFGGFFIMILGQSLLFLLIFAIVKIMIDLSAHIKEHKTPAIIIKTN